jgi:nitrogenase molybdenum-iron protein NifN
MTPIHLYQHAEPAGAAPMPPLRAATRNPCHLCAPLGAALAFKGVEGAIALLHGSQGCSTYIRRYTISHFREPIDIASSNFSEVSAIFGGKSNLHTALANLTTQYAPSLIGIATTCLSETIGDDVRQLLHDYAGPLSGPALVHVSTPSYAGTHVDGFHAAIRAIVAHFTPSGPSPLGRGQGEGRSCLSGTSPLALFPNLVSPADLRHLKEIITDFDIPYILVPDYSDTLDGPAWEGYLPLAPGGTSVASLRQLPEARAALAFTRTLPPDKNPTTLLATRCAVPGTTLGLPIGTRETDAFFDYLAALSGRDAPAHHTAERGRLVDAYVDSHKYLFGRRAVLVGDPDLLIGIARFLGEVGVVPCLVAPNTHSPDFARALRDALPPDSAPVVLDHPDFATLAQAATDLHAEQSLDLIVGSSKAYPLAKQLNVPLLRVGFPIHDRFGAPRLLHLGYRGTQQLLDRTVNLLLEHHQDSNDIGYAYL